MVDTTVAGPPAEPAEGTPNPAQPGLPFCTVDGERVTEFRALIDGQAGAVITPNGSFVFGRVYFCPGPKGSHVEGKPGFDLGDGHSRTIAGQEVRSARFQSNCGLWVHFTDYVAFVPAAALKASWRRP